MGGCQNDDPFWGTLNIWCRIIIGIQKGTIILTTTHITLHAPRDDVMCSMTAARKAMQRSILQFDPFANSGVHISCGTCQEHLGLPTCCPNQSAGGLGRSKLFWQRSTLKQKQAVATHTRAHKDLCTDRFWPSKQTLPHLLCLPLPQPWWNHGWHHSTHLTPESGHFSLSYPPHPCLSRRGEEGHRVSLAHAEQKVAVGQWAPLREISRAFPCASPPCLPLWRRLRRRWWRPRQLCLRQ